MSSPLQRLRRIGLAASLAAAAAACVASISPAAAVVIGQFAPPGTPPPSILGCNGSSRDFLQPTVTNGTPYLVPATVPNWTITSWTTYASDDAGQRWAMKVFRHINGSSYRVVGHDSHVLNPGRIQAFAARFQVKAGDVLGLNQKDGSAADSACAFVVQGESLLLRNGNLGDGESGSFLENSNALLNIAATVEPTNAFKLRKARLNKGKGTAKLPAKLPNPGKLALAGKGVKRVAKTVNAPGNVKLKIRAKGKKKRKLEEGGKVKLTAKVTFTPTGGEPRTKSLKLKLIKKR